MINKKNLMIYLLLLFLSSCGSYDYIFEKELLVTIDMPRKEFQKMIDDGDIYKLKDNREARITKRYFGPAPEFFAYVFENDKLIFWGFIHEFKRHPDDKLSKIGEELTEIVLELKEQEK